MSFFKVNIFLEKINNISIWSQWRLRSTLGEYGQREICRSKYTKYQAQLENATSFHHETYKGWGTGSLIMSSVKTVYNLPLE